ncbi:hypothetical protein Hdeb2414_s0019g00545991 [Helianthus debilis subsp. tardiflorus]
MWLTKLRITILSTEQPKVSSQLLLKACIPGGLGTSYIPGGWELHIFPVDGSFIYSRWYGNFRYSRWMGDRWYLGTL